MSVPILHAYRVSRSLGRYCECLSWYATIRQQIGTPYQASHVNMHRCSSSRPAVAYTKAYCTQLLTDPERSCWQCAKSVPMISFFCECGVIQRPSCKWTYFDVMGLEVTFDIDTSLLSKKMIELQKLLHPDKFSSKTKEEQTFAADCSSLINNAFTTLSKPVSRATYILGLHGFSVAESKAEIDPEFLMEMLELNERLEDAQTSGAGAVSEVDAVGVEVDGAIERMLDNLAEKLRSQEWEEGLGVLQKINYFESVRLKFQQWHHNRL